MATEQVAEAEGSRGHEGDAEDGELEMSLAEHEGGGRDVEGEFEMRKGGPAEERLLNSRDFAGDDEIDTRCGIGSCRPNWLQKFARIEVYVLVHGMLGFIYFADATYFIGTLSTVEKHLKIPSRTTGMIQSGYEIGTMAALPFMGYAARHAHPMRLLGGGAALAGIACMCFALPYLIFGAGRDSWTADSVYFPAANSSNATDVLCGTTMKENCESGDDGSFGAVVLFYIANLLAGIGCAAQYSVGLAYLDNNSRKNKAPIFLAATECVGMLGSTLGFALSAAALAHYVDPALHPPFGSDDPRWIGAWWLGWPLIGALTVMAGGLVLLFPRQLPRAAKRRELLQSETTAVPQTPHEKPSLRDFKVTLQRLFKNKVLVFNICSAVCLMFGYSGYWTFMPKYIETQYYQTASQANLITGAIGLVCTGAGMGTAALVITHFRPPPRALAAWNVFTELVDVLGHVTWAFLGCSARHLHGVLTSHGSWNLTAACNVECGCGPEVKYEPVCSELGTTFYSPCHAGCSDAQVFDNGTKVFNNCSCIPSGSAIDGPCAAECAASFTVFLAMQCLMSFLQASGRSGNALLAFRCVDERDKSLSIALGEFLLCLLAFFPAPTAFGMLLDTVCLVWGESCGETGNCWLYDEQYMRYLLNFTAAGCLLVGVLFDVGVWMHCSHLKLYDDDDTNRTKMLTAGKSAATEQDITLTMNKND